MIPHKPQQPQPYVVQSKDTRASSFGGKRGPKPKEEMNPIDHAILILKIVRKCIKDNQPFSEVYVRDLSELVWMDLLNAATPNEMAIINNAIVAHKRDRKLVNIAEQRYERERLRQSFIRQ